MEEHGRILIQDLYSNPQESKEKTNVLRVFCENLHLFSIESFIKGLNITVIRGTDPIFLLLAPGPGSFKRFKT